MSDVCARDIIACGRIYEHMGDELSRELYKRMLDWYLGNLDNLDYADGIRLVGESSIRDFDEFYSKFESNPNIIIYGAGKAGRFTAKELLHDNRYREKVVGICDRTAGGTDTYMGVKIMSVEEACKSYNAIFFCCSLSPTVRMDMYRTLIWDGGVDHSRIFLIHEFAKKDYCGQYFDLFKPIEHEFFLDCGCLDLGTSMEFINWSDGKYDRIIAFEPDEVSYLKSKNRIGIDDRIDIINAGVYSRTVDMNFDATHDGSARLVEDGVSQVHCVAIDDLGADKVTFIKMDIEGAEEEALYGAENTIKKWHPALAISMYHKPNDVFRLPEVVLSMYEGYKFYIRTYTNWRQETVLYAITEDRELFDGEDSIK